MKKLVILLNLMSFVFVYGACEKDAISKIEAAKCSIAGTKSASRKFFLQASLMNYTPHEALIESVEEGRNDIKYFVGRYGRKLLYKKDAANDNKNILEIAQDAENFLAVRTIRTLMTKHPFEKINKKNTSTK